MANEREKMEEVFNFIKRLSDGDLDHSGGKLGTREKPFIFKGSWRRLDLSEAKGFVKVISTGLINILDVSGSKFKLLELEGNFNVVDASGSRIKRYDRSNARILVDDMSCSEIGNVIG